MHVTIPEPFSKPHERLLGFSYEAEQPLLWLTNVLRGGWLSGLLIKA
jgi:hypothetical protein